VALFFSKEDEVTAGGVQVLRANNINKDRYELNFDDIRRVSPKTDFSDEKKLRRDDIFICLASGSKDHVGKVALIKEDTDFYMGGFMGAIRVKPERLYAGYLLKQLTTGHFNDFLRGQIAGANINNLSGGVLYRFKIPLPPLDVQKEIVAEIEGYQKVIDGACAVVDNYRPHIPIRSNWPMVRIGDLVTTAGVGVVKSKGEQDLKHPYPYIKMNNITTGGRLELSDVAYVNASSEEIAQFALQDGDYLYNTRNSPELVGKSAVFHGGNGVYLFNNNILRIRFSDRAHPDFVNAIMIGPYGQSKIRAQVDGTTSVAALYQRNYFAIEIPLPPFATQRAIVAELEAEQALVNANCELIARMEKKIQATLARIWDEDEKTANPSPAEA
jgi:restriction endonuclease S subunit